MAEETSDWGFVFGLFSFMVLMICGLVCFANYQTSIQCTDHQANGYTTKLMGSPIVRTCYVEVPTGDFVPLDSLYQIDNYNKLA